MWSKFLQEKAFGKNHAGAALIVAITVLALVTVIGYAVLKSTSNEVFVSGQSRKRQQLASMANNALENITTWLRYWAKNTPSGNHPRLFVKSIDPNLSNWTYYKRADDPYYHNIPVDAQDGPQAVFKLAEKFLTMLNDPNSYVGPGWQNDESGFGGASIGVFYERIEPKENVKVKVWVEPALIGAGNLCSGSGSPAVSCIETLQYRGQPEYAIRLYFKAMAERQGQEKKRVTIKREVQVLFKQEVYGNFHNEKIHPCMICHVSGFANFVQSGDSNLEVDSKHAHSAWFGGDVKMTALWDLDKWANPINIQRTVGCASGHSCVASAHGQALEDPRNPGNPLLKCGDDTDRACYYVDGDPFNGSQQILGNLIEKSTDEPAPIPQLVEYSKKGLISETHKTNKLCPQFDLSCSKEDYPALVRFDWSENSSTLAKEAVDSTVIKANPNLQVYFATGKRKPGAAPTSDYYEDGTIDSFRAWHSNGNDITKTFLHMDPSRSMDSMTRPYNDPNAGLTVEGSMIINNNSLTSNRNTPTFVGCGTINIRDDLILSSTCSESITDPTQCPDLVFAVTADCPTDKLTINVGGNIYIGANVIAAGSPDYRADNSALPNNGRYYTDGEYESRFPTSTKNHLMLFAAGSVMDIGMLTSGYKSTFTQGGVMNTESSGMIGDYTTSPRTDPIANLRINGVYKDDYEISNTNYALGLYPVDNSDDDYGRGPRTNELIDIFQVTDASKYTKPDTGTQQMVTEQVNTLNFGIAPMGADMEFPLVGVSGNPGNSTRMGTMFAGEDPDNPDPINENSSSWIRYDQLVKLAGVNVSAPDSHGLYPPYLDLSIVKGETEKHNRVNEINGVTIAANMVMFSKRSDGDYGDEGDEDILGGQVETWAGELIDNNTRRDGFIYAGNVFARDFFIFAPGSANLIGRPDLLNIPEVPAVSRILIVGPIEYE